VCQISAIWTRGFGLIFSCRDILIRSFTKMAEMDDQIETLPLLQRFALTYAPRDARPLTLGLMALDNRLAGIVSRASEPMLAQIRLAWWRELLTQEPSGWPKGEPLLALLHHWQGRAADLVPLVNGWECAVSGGDALAAADIQRLAQARGAAFGVLAGVLGHSEAAGVTTQMAGDWALADLAAHLSNPADRETAREMLADGKWARQRLPRALRPVAVLNGLAAGSVKKGTGLDQLSPAAIIPAMRIGLFGL
jgi:phytoene synthase